MKKTIQLAILAGLLGLPAVCNATLIDRGDGLIYDDILKITWLQDANYAKSSGYDSDGLMSWAGAKAWAAQLNYGGTSGWRLPTVKPGGSDWKLNFSNDNSTDLGYNKSTPNNELAFMYLNNLGLKSRYSPAGEYQQTGLTEYNNTVGLVTNLIAFAYWNDTAYPLWPSGLAFDFYVGEGLQDYYFQETELYAWAVHDGDIANINRTPEPTITALMIAALGGLLLHHRRGCRT